MNNFLFLIAFLFEINLLVLIGSVWGESGNFVDPNDTASDTPEDFERNSGTIDDDVDYSGSTLTNFRSLHKDMLHPDRRQIDNLCVINIEKADVIFAVDIGRTFPAVATLGIKDFIMSTIKVMELQQEKIRIGIFTMGASNESVSVLLPLADGTSHRAIQESLNKISSGNYEFNYTKMLQKIDGVLKKERNVTRIVISVLSGPVLKSEGIREILLSVNRSSRAVYFYHVTLGISMVTVEEVVDFAFFEKRFFGPATIMVPKSEFWSLSRSSEVARMLMKKFGCNHCLPNPCAFGSSCRLTDSSYQCYCPLGHVSGVCAPCQSNPCNQSRCLVSGDSYLCDPCDPNRCENDGKCLYKKDTSICVCPPNYVGRYCEFVCPVCRNGGTCKYLNGSAVCECLDGYIGETCDLTCSKFNCLNGGTCGLDKNRNPICSCPEPFYGPRCESSCKEDTCRNGGSCGIANRAQFCHCLPRFEGKFCEIDRCESYFRCANGGICQVNQETNRVECLCFPPFSGADCSITPCTEYACYNGGTCVLDLALRPFCACVPPFTGEKCLEEDGCVSNPCSNRGTCFVNSQNQVSCQCAFGFSGKFCMNNPCIPNPCWNEAQCQPRLSGATQDEYIFKCFCLDGFEGIFCERKVKTTSTVTSTSKTVFASTTALADVCTPNPCSPPCQCLPSCKHADGFFCASKDGRLGKTCSIPPPTLTCRSDNITISIDDRLLQELSGSDRDSAYFALSVNEPQYSSECTSTTDVTKFGQILHKLVLYAPFTSCGSITSINNKTISVSNNIWFNVVNDDFEMPVPILKWTCDYKSEYSVKTSITPAINKGVVHITRKNKEFLSAHFQICKVTTQCVESCPDDLIVQPGAVYTVGQRINIIVAPSKVIGEPLHLIDFYLSCGKDTNYAPSLVLIENGCQSNDLGVGLSNLSNSLCIIFQLPLLRNCNVAYLHAKLSQCPPKSACARLSGNRCDESKRRKRSVIEVDHFGPIYILESGDAWFKTGSNISGDADQEFTQEPEKDFVHDFVIDYKTLAAAILAVCIITSIFFAFAYRKNYFLYK